MTINEEGFLSPEISEWVRKHRTESHAWFALAEDLNRIGQYLQLRLKVPADDKPALLTALLFMRALSGFQGAILLAERGMTQEARTLVRGCFETLFFIGAIRNDPAFVDELISDDASRREKIARILLGLPVEASGLESGHIERLRAYLSSLAESGIETQSLAVVRAAQIAGLTNIYDVYYRALSNDAAHPSITALNRHVIADEDGLVAGLRSGPHVNDIEDTLLAACTAAVHVIALSHQDATAPGLERCWQEYKRLVSAAA